MALSHNYCAYGNNNEIPPRVRKYRGGAHFCGNCKEWKSNDDGKSVALFNPHHPPKGAAHIGTLCGECYRAAAYYKQEAA